MRPGGRAAAEYGAGAELTEFAKLDPLDSAVAGRTVIFELLSSELSVRLRVVGAARELAMLAAPCGTFREGGPASGLYAPIPRPFLRFYPPPRPSETISS